MIEDQHSDDHPFEEWEDGWDVEEEDLEPIQPPPWRKPLLIAVAALTAVAMAIVPLYNVFFARTVADNGLEVCGFDYCVVVDAVREAGLDLTMSRLSNTFLDDAETRDLLDAATDYLGVAPVGLEVVDELEGRLGGVYDRASRMIRIERPARAWTVLHEVAHVEESGHDEDFQRVLIELAQWADLGD
ncbi:MAG: hypothetical protein PVJ28_01990 [Acidimicrobiia bacterium]